MGTRSEDLASKAMGAVKDLKATALGLHGVFKELEEEHGRVTALVMQTKASSDPHTRQELFATIRAELSGHEQGELREVYPIFRDHAELESIAVQHEAEAGNLERALDELHAIPVEDSSWASRFEALAQLISRHVEEEENDYFPTAERVLGRKMAEEIQGRYERTKQSVTEQVMHQP